MAKKQTRVETNPSTEEKIKAAARIIFHKKGFSGTRTRDIAEEANINLALLNYYFRSKEKLFQLIMMEDVKFFLESVSINFNDEKTSFDEKIDRIVSGYIDMLIKQPHIPIFVLSELRSNPDRFITNVGVKDMIMNSVFLKQFMEVAQSGKIKVINPIHLIMNLISMTVFPFVASPVLKNGFGMNDENFNELMNERKTLIPEWIKQMIYI
ncbi:MAG: AcrR family transcriptional regulator [Spirosomataceae bacterium]